MKPGPDDFLQVSLDRAFHRLGVDWDRSWDPIAEVRRQQLHRRRWLTASTAAMVFMAGIQVWRMTRSVPRHEAGTLQVALPSLSPQVRATVARLHVPPSAVRAWVPVYARYPQAAPSGFSLAFAGRFRLPDGQEASDLTLETDVHHRVTGGTAFNAAGTPIWGFTGSVAAGRPIPAAPVRGIWAGRWMAGGAGALNAFSAAGPFVYLAAGSEWTRLQAGRPAYWQTAPFAPADPGLSASIAALPADPRRVLLLEETPAGLDTGYVSPDGGHTWRPWLQGTVPVSGLEALGRRFWAVVDGALATSRDGRRFTALLAPDPRRWEVAAYAVNPARPGNLAAALAPVTGPGPGPVLVTRDGGRRWHALPPLPVPGMPPSTLTVSPRGTVTALLNLDRPVLARWTPGAEGWQLWPVPGVHGTPGAGTLAAAPDGSLFYGSPSGTLYRMGPGHRSWRVIAPPPAVRHQTPLILEAIGRHQLLAAYESGWYIYVSADAS
ncbi:conserved protein of unknown function [Candidatus Hydrogenisulfobacillus filiaventi]|uniref:Uncharacterized protein n=1 Tax=Candidatus Hydrogenisulfobacillus filiaventi TaxID=2707344 RepID=A0A6F8ZGL5_9FIRM|nr:hypothetical protein [Bacillota bacterium]CAB1128847.1 conserved protein of unknown function [Candidatus Hydrogenisulfobacillus filiaventi]